MAKRKKYWLLKTEPDAYSITDLANEPDQTAGPTMAVGSALEWYSNTPSPSFISSRRKFLAW